MSYRYTTTGPLVAEKEDMNANPPSQIPLRLPAHFSASHSDDFCSPRPRLSPILERRESSTSSGICVQGGLQSSTSAPAVAALNDTFGVQVGASDCSSLKVPPGLGHDLLGDTSYGELDSYHTALDLQDFGSSDFELVPVRPPSIDSSGSVRCLHSEDSSMALSGNNARCRFSLSSLEFLGTLGRGGYGKVLLARSADCSELAVKVLSKKNMTLDDVMEVKAEVQILQSISQRSDVGVAFCQEMHAAFQTKEHVFIAMVRHGATLSHPTVRNHLRLRPVNGLDSPTDNLPNSVSLPVAFPSCQSISTSYDEALNMLRLLSAELILGLLFLHSLGIVHQDLKPANVLISVSGHAVITDFGSARFQPPSTLSSRQHPLDESPEFTSNAAWTSTRPRFGSIVLHEDDRVSYTRRYAAPELLQAPAEMQGRDVLVYDERVDFYGLGAMLRELALGKPVEDFQADFGDKWERASDGARRASVEVDAEFTDFTEKLLAHDADERLHGPAAKRHAFFDPIEELWDDIGELRYPPFTDAIWPEAEDDTRLDLRAYGGEQGDDSFEDACQMQNWFEELADIPFDVLEEPPVSREEVVTPTVSIGRVVVSPCCSQESDLATSLSAHIAGNTSKPRRPLSCMPTIPSLDSTMAEPVKQATLVRHPEQADSDIKDPASGLGAGRETPPLRRRQVVDNLRQAFLCQLAPVSSRLAKSTSHRRNKAKESVPSRSALASAIQLDNTTGVSPLWSFEHQITIALLATMGQKRSAAVAGAPRRPREGDVQRATRGGETRDTTVIVKTRKRLRKPRPSTSQASPTRSEAQSSVLRKLKGLV